MGMGCVDIPVIFLFMGNYQQSSYPIPSEVLIGCALLSQKILSSDWFILDNGYWISIKRLR